MYIDMQLLRCLARETFLTQHLTRTPEPDLVMSDAHHVHAFAHGGRVDGPLAAYYLFSSGQMVTAMAPGATVVDLGCGPANQLALMAQLAPDCRFIGVDFSHGMLATGRAHCEGLGLSNVELRHDDMTTLATIAAASVDCVVSSLTLHHLADTKALEQTFAAIARVLKPGGTVCLCDFTSLKGEASIRYLVGRGMQGEPALLAVDHEHSLRAAFGRDQLRAAAHATWGDAARVETTGPLNFGLVRLGAAARPAPEIASRRAALSGSQRIDLLALRLVLACSNLFRGSPKPSVMKSLYQPSMARWLWGAAGDWAIIIATMALARWVNHPLSYVLGALIVGTRHHAFMILLHDASHFTISRRPWLNDLISDAVCGWWVSQTTRSFRKWHLAHHRLNGAEGDPEHAVKALSSDRYWSLPTTLRGLLKGVLVDLSGLSTVRVLRFWLMYPPVNAADRIGPLLVPVVMFSLVTALDQQWIPLMWIGATFTSFPAAYRARMWTEHVGTETTHRLTMPWWQRMLFAPHNTWYHWEHHAWPFVPYWRLPESRELHGPSPAILPFNDVFTSMVATGSQRVTARGEHEASHLELRQRGGGRGGAGDG